MRLFRKFWLFRESPSKASQAENAGSIPVARSLQSPQVNAATDTVTL